MDLLTLEVLATENPRGCIQRNIGTRGFFYFHAKCLLRRVRGNLAGDRAAEFLSKATPVPEFRGNALCEACLDGDSTPWTC